MNGDSKPLFSIKWWIAFCISILAIAFITVSLIDSRDLPITIIGAVLGVVMTVFASFILLKGQSEQQAELANKQSRLQADLTEKQTELQSKLQLDLARRQNELQSDLQEKLVRQQGELQLDLARRQNEIEQERQKETAIFQEKLNSYNLFLNALCKYVESKDEASKSILKFRTAALAMHCDNLQMIETNRNVGDIIKMYQSADENDEELLMSLFNISDCFREALYSNDGDKGRTAEQRTALYKESIKELMERFEDGRDASDPQDERNDTLHQEETIEEESKAVGGWQDYIKSLKNQGWAFDVANDQINLSKDDALASVRIRKPRKGTFYVVEVISKNGDADFAKGLKAQFKGARSGGSWWRELTSLPNYGVKSGQLTTSLEDNAKARTVIIKWIDKLTDYIAR